MASIRVRLEKIKEDPGELIDAAVVLRSCAQAGYRWRERTLGPVATLGAMALQAAHGNTAIAHVVRLAGGRFSESAYCQARARLPVAVVRAQLTAFLSREADGAGGLWKGHRLVLIDGTGLSTPDTPALRAHFGTAGGLADGLGLPCVKTLIVFRAHDGMLLDLHLASACAGDLRHARDLHPALGAGDILVGDRGLCAYTHLAELRELGAHGVFRMQACRAMPFPARSGRRRRFAYNRHRRSEPLLIELIAKDDQIVELVKPHNRPPTMTPEAFAKIPSTLVVRAVRYVVAEKGSRTHQITLLTTLTDPREYPARDLAALYLMRWRVEINMRHLKRTLGMDRLKCADVDGVTREVLMLAFIYNAVCRVRARAAATRNVEPTTLSFIDTLRAIIAAIAIDRVVLPRPPDLKRWPRRPPRHHPRRLKHLHSNYPLLTKPRNTLARSIPVPPPPN